MPVVHSDAGKLASPEKLERIPALLSAYYTEYPDPKNPEQKVSFGTSGHRGSSLAQSFNEEHIFAIAQAVCDYRNMKGIDGPLYMGGDTPCPFGSRLSHSPGNACGKRRSCARCQSRRPCCDPGRFPCNFAAQRGQKPAACRRHHYHPFAQSPKGRRLQVQSPPRRPGRYRCYQLD